MGRHSNPLQPGDRYDPNRGHDGDWLNNKDGRYDGRAAAALTRDSRISDREWQAVKKHGKS